METKKILVIGRHAHMLQNVMNLLNNNGYMAYGETDNQKAIATFKTAGVHAVIIGGGVDDASRRYFEETFRQLQPRVKIIYAHPHSVLMDVQQAFLNS